MNRRFALIRANPLQRYFGLVGCQRNYRVIGIGGREIDKNLGIDTSCCLMPALCNHCARCALVKSIFVAFEILSIETSRNGSNQFVESKS